ncbi:hypothetical protein SDC9_200692 [bioreactor metagenome]|uniref:Uncharacterized protein n=1 Tax=bioreactor metagenome TaxID=1076179 RepID=A0A645IRP0_9ZZZZ
MPHEVVVLRSGPCGDDQGKLLLKLVLRNVVADKRPDTGNPEKVVLLNQLPDDLSNGHMADGEGAAQLRFGRELRSARIIAELDLTQDFRPRPLGFGHLPFAFGAFHKDEFSLFYICLL